MSTLPINQIIQGDCRAVMADWPENSVDLGVVDPPYAQTSLQWDRPVAGWPAVMPTRSMWVFGSLRAFVAMWDELVDWKLSQDLVWEKHNGSNFHADRFRRVHEQVAHFYRGRWLAIYHKPVFTRGATKRTLRRTCKPQHLRRIGDRAYESQDGGPLLMRSVLHVRSCHGTALHPTQKPLDMVRPLIEYACPPGGTVVVPFCGSGTTCVAAKMLGRNYIGIEVSGEYCEIARQRLAAVETGVPVAERRAGQRGLFE